MKTNSGGVQPRYMNYLNREVKVKKEKEPIFKNLKGIYSKVQEREAQRTHPFGVSAKKSESFNDYEISGLRCGLKKCDWSHKDNIEVNLGNFYQTMPDDSEIQPQRHRRYRQPNTTRVILPERNRERLNDEGSKKKMIDFNKNYHRTNGNILSLLNKTPEQYFHGNIERKHCYKTDHVDIFGEKFLDGPLNYRKAREYPYDCQTDHLRDLNDNYSYSHNVNRSMDHAYNGSHCGNSRLQNRIERRNNGDDRRYQKFINK